MTRKEVKQLLTVLLALGSIFGSVSNAFAQYENDKFDKEERKLAEKGDARAEWDLGQWYLKPHYHKNVGDVIAMMGTQTLGKAKPAEAARWLHRAADHGYADPAQEAGLGTMYMQERNFAEALFWLRRAADLGNADAMERVGDCYSLGLGVAADPVEALDWYGKAGAAGVHLVGRHSLYAVGVAFLHAGGPRIALGYLTEATKENDLDAMELLGEIYRDGNGVQKDPTVAQGWFNLRQLILNQQAQQAAAEKQAVDEQKRESRQALIGAITDGLNSASFDPAPNTTQSTIGQQQADINAALQRQLQAQQAAQARAAAAAQQAPQVPSSAGSNSQGVAKCQYADLKMCTVRAQ